VRLGFWNRLAIVAGALFSLGGATWMIISERMQSNEIMRLGYSACIDGVGIPNSGVTVKYCGDVWLKSTGGVGWEEWFQAVGALALFAVIIYCIIWLAVWVVKWILRGRGQNT
jgi:hypothetical protein